jgi:hypothetical protein
MTGAPWTPIEPVRGGRSGRWFAALAPAAAGVLCIVLGLQGHLLAALLVGAALAAFLQARLVSPAFARRFDVRLARVAAAVGRGAGTAVSWVLLGAIFVVVFLPASLVALVFRRRRSLGRPRGQPGFGWVPRGDVVPARSPRRTFGVESGRARNAPSSVPATVLTLVGIVGILVLVDLVAGAILLGTGLLPGDRGDTRADVEGAVRTTMEAPAVRDEPWAQAFGEAMIAFQLSDDDYVPYLVQGPHPFESPYLNTTQHERVSYRPEVDAGVEPLRVAFLGGSVMFGVGQRDEHTIPSEFARLAEADGIPVEVHNYGFPGWVAWQEFQYLERLLAAGERFDLVVSYDGFNEFLVQRTDFANGPTHLGRALLDQVAREYHLDHETEPGYLDGLHELWASYRENSAIGRLIEQWRGDEDAAATVAATPEEQADAALDVYARASARITDLVGGPESVSFFWQPQRVGWPPEITDRLAPTVHDLSPLFDGREDQYYVDEVHTNEPGARLVAEAMWAELGPALSREAGGP